MRTRVYAEAVRAVTQAARSLPEGASLPQRALSRRAALALLAGAAACSPKASQPTASPREDGPIVIVGGGASGLLVAWRLAAAGRRVAVYEASGRTGGRMFTQRDLTPEGHFCELGGEFVSTRHVALIALCKELGLAVERLRPQAPARSALYDFGGASRTDVDLLDAPSQPGPFTPIAARIAADQRALLDAKGAWTPRALDLDRLSLKAYLDSLKDSTEPWVIAFLACAYRGEFGLPLEQQSSLNLVDFIGTDATQSFSLFGRNDDALRITGGSQSLPDALASRLLEAPLSEHASLHLRHELVHIGRNGSDVKLTFKAPDGGKTVLAKRIVFALPFTRLRTIAGLGGLGLSAGKMRAINELGYGANAKLAVATKSRPWQDGALFNLDALLTGAVYSDRGFEQIWDASAGQPGKFGIITNLLSADKARLEETAAFVQLEHGLKALSPDLAAALIPELRTSFFWPSHPQTLASYSAAKVGQYTGLFEHAGTTELGGAVLFAGEHASLAHYGFMNGAVDAGERVAREILAAA